jgi:predicted PurR-regulated permease PerM
MNGFLSKPAVKIAVILAGAVLFLWFVYTARVALYPFIIAFAFAYILDPVVDRMEKAGLGRTSSVVMLLAIFFAIIMAAMALLIPIIAGQVEAMARNVPRYAELVKEKALPIIERIPEMDRAKVEESVKQAMATLGDIPLKVLKSTSGAVWTGITNVAEFLLGLLNLVIIPVATFYLLKDFDSLLAKVASRVPPRYKPGTARFFGKLDAALGAFVRGQLTVAVIMGAIYSTGLFLIGAPVGVLIGLLAGLANIVPYLPVVVGLLPALILTYLQYSDWQHVGMVAGLFALGMAVEGFVITPRTLEKAVGLHPVAVMASILMGAVFFGFIGVLLAVPTAAVVKVALVELDGAYLSSAFFNAGDEGGSD